MNRRASVRLSLQTKETESDTVPVTQKTRRLSRLKSRKSILTTKENEIRAIPVAPESPETPIIDFKSSNDEVYSESKKKRKSTIGLDLAELTISDKSDIQPEIKQRRFSMRLALKKPVNSNEETVSVPVKNEMRRLSELKIRKSIVTVNGNGIEATIVKEESQRPTLIDFNNSNIMDEKLVEPSEKRKTRRSSIKLGLPELTTSEESEIQKKIKNRRSATRLTLKKPLETNEEPEPVPSKRRKKRVSICMPNKSTKKLSSQENIEPLNNNVSRRSLVKNTLDCNDLTQIKKYYLDKTVTNKKTRLETIFEETSNSNKLMGRKLRRLIPFSEINQQKDRKNYQWLKQYTERKQRSVDEALKSLKDDSDRK